jgi:hypothetical protein
MTKAAGSPFYRFAWPRPQGPFDADLHSAPAERKPAGRVRTATPLRQRPLSSSHRCWCCCRTRRRRPRLSSSARVLAPRHGRDKQPGEARRKRTGAPRAPQFHGWSEAVITLRHPSPSQNCSFLSRVFSRLLPVLIWKSEKWAKLLVLIFEIRKVSASSRFSSCINQSISRFTFMRRI